MQRAALSQDLQSDSSRQGAPQRRGNGGPTAPSPLSVPLGHPSGPRQSPLAPFGGAACCARGPRAGHQCWGAACPQAPPADLGSSAPEARIPPSGCSRAEAGRQSCRRPRRVRGDTGAARVSGAQLEPAAERGEPAERSAPAGPAQLLEPSREAHGARRFLLPSMSLLPEDWSSPTRFGPSLLLLVPVSKCVRHRRLWPAEAARGGPRLHRRK